MKQGFRNSLNKWSVHQVLSHLTRSFPEKNILLKRSEVSETCNAKGFSNSVTTLLFSDPTPFNVGCYSLFRDKGCMPHAENDCNRECWSSVSISTSASCTGIQRE